MSAPTPPAGGPIETPPSDKDEAGVTTAETKVKTIVLPPLLGLWLLIAGLWETGEVAWVILRGLARLIA